MIVPGMFVCSSFLIRVCMFIVSKALLISSATVIVRAGGAIWLNPFATVLFSVCSTVNHVHYVIKDTLQGREIRTTTSKIMVSVIQMASPSQESNHLFSNNPLKNFNNGRSK